MRVGPVSVLCKNSFMIYRAKSIFWAFQMTLEARDSKSTWPEWLVRLWKSNRFKESAVWPDVMSLKLYCGTDKRKELINFGDYICCVEDNGALLVNKMSEEEFISKFELADKEITGIDIPIKRYNVYYTTDPENMSRVRAVEEPEGAYCLYEDLVKVVNLLSMGGKNG